MAVSLCDGMAYRIMEDEIIERSQALSFFLNGHIEDALLVYDRDGKYSGIITYKSLLYASDMNQAVVREKLVLEEGKGECFWERAQNLIQGSNDSMLPVFNRDMELLYFARYNSELNAAWTKLLYIQWYVDENLWKNFKGYHKHIHFTGAMSDVLYFFRKWLCSVGTKVSVEGEVWRLLGIEEADYVAETANIVDEECTLLESVYAYYRGLMEESVCEDVAELKELLLKPYISADAEKRKIIFELTEHSFFAESISALIIYYLQRGDIECVALFPTLDRIMIRNLDNVKKIAGIVKRIESFGGKCYSMQVPKVLEQEYDVCYFCSEYSGSLSLIKAKYVVGLQTTAVYTHMYYVRGKFEEVFSDKARGEIDYLVTSEFIADWIGEKNQKWEEKILGFGYPKLDTLYQSLSSPEIPEEWLERTKGKKVFLFVVDSISEEIWNYFSDSADNVLIWRPHPMIRDRISWKKEMEKRSKMHNVIVDKRLSYYASFRLSDALVAVAPTSVTVNYLYMDKPVCILDSKEPSEELAIDYRQEAWYKCAYIAFGTDDILDFLEMVSRGGDRKKDELEPYRKCMVNHFDGKVCERIYNYFEESIE